MTQFFNPVPKPKREKSLSLRKRMKLCFCVVCGSHGTKFNPIDPEHFITWGSGIGPGDTEENMNPICRRCHRRKGIVGRKTFWAENKEKIQHFRKMQGLPEISKEFIEKFELEEK